MLFEFVSWGCRNKLHTFGGLKEQEFVLSHFWMSEVPNQGLFRAKLSAEALGENLFFASSSSWWLLAFPSLCRLPLVCLHITSLCVSLCRLLLTVTVSSIHVDNSGYASPLKIFHLITLLTI